MSLSLRFAARSDVGLIRDGNEDSGYAGPRLLAVADGLGGQAAGEVASSAVVTTIAVLDHDEPGPEILDVLGDKVVEANDLLRRMIEENPQLEGMGTTLTALLWSGSKFGMVHIGDSRAYLLRDGMLQQVSDDHTWVQRLVDEGRITPDEADHHPQRSLLMRAIDGRGQVDLDLRVLPVRVGDRYLLCSDGLSSVVSRDTLQETLAVGGDPAQVAESLVQLARRGGGPDNITCIVADIIDVEGWPGQEAVVVGAASEERHQKAVYNTANSPAERAAMLQQTAVSTAGDGTAAMPGAFETDAEASAAGRPKRRRWLWFSLALAVVLIVVGGGAGAYLWSQGRYYVAASSGQVAIFKGVDQSVLGVSLSSLYQSEPIPVVYLSQTNQARVRQTISASSLGDAHNIVATLKQDMCTQVAAEQAGAAATVPPQQPVTPPAVTPARAATTAALAHAATAAPAAAQPAVPPPAVLPTTGAAPVPAPSPSASPDAASGVPPQVLSECSQG